MPTATDIVVVLDVIVHTPAWQDTLPDAEPYITTICHEVFRHTGVCGHIAQLELSVTLADDEYVQELNNQYRHKNKPTNVLSFPNLVITPPHFDKIENYNGYALLGDIILSLETLEKEAAEQQKSFKAHFSHLVVHGLLHLLGYDHEIENEATIMESLEAEILARFDIASPYEA